MGKVDIKLTRSGPRQLRQSAGVQADLAARAARVAARAGAGFVASSMTGRTRARASVITTDRQSREAEATGRALTRALDAGR